MVKVLVIEIDGKSVCVFDEHGLMERAKFKKLSERDIYHFFIRHVAEGVKICHKTDGEFK